MNKTLLLSTFRSVKNTISRFVAIFAIIAIGCGFFAGVKAASPDMKDSTWDYYRKQNLSDFHLLSTLGFEEDEVEAIRQHKNTNQAEAGYSSELVITSSDSTQKIVKTYSYDSDAKINKLLLKEGRFPEKSNECVADYKFYSSENLNIGDTITFSTGNDREIDEILTQTSYTVVGLVQSPLYISYERGAASIGNGIINGYVYLPEENFDMEVYTDVYVTVDGASDIDPFSDKYAEIISSAADSYEEMSKVQVEKRIQKITDEAYVDINEAKEELEDGKKEIEDGKKDLEDGKKDLEDGEKEYNDGVKAKEELVFVNETLKKILTDYETDAVESTDVVQEQIDVLNQGENFEADENLQQLLMGYMLTPAAYDNGTKAMSRVGLEQYISALDDNINEAEIQLSDVLSKIEDAKAEIADAEKEIADGEKEIADGEKEIADAEEELADTVKDAEWFVFNRDDYNIDYANFEDDCNIVDSVAKVFPVFFILVAALVCWTTMTRMVEEQRIQIGTLKALGYGQSAIMSQYVLYAVAASVPGAFVGLLLGLNILPKVIFDCYQTMYAMPYIIIPFKWDYAVGCVAVSCICTGVSSVYACRRELISKPAQLMRPKAPKNGKRIFLERITPMWKRMKFSNKVTLRNIFRYKSRVFMTVIGVAGCTALLVAAFGLQYAISCVVERQYGRVFLYDAIVAIDDNDNTKSDIISAANETGYVENSMTAMQKFYDVYNSDGDSIEVYLVSVSDAEQLKNYISIHDRVTQKPIELTDDGVVINEKLSKLLDVKAGDKIYFNEGYDLKVIGVTENYTMNYVYMTDEYYKKVGFEDEKEDNIIFVNMTDVTKETEFSEQLIDRDDVLAVSYAKSGGDSMRQLSDSLSVVVVAIIISAGALAFVVMFNLANININERVHELATIKVLGFFDGEVAAYIYRENTISAITGMILGLVLGVCLEKYVIMEAEVDIVMFAPEIPLHCFLLASGLTLCFAVVVNLFLYFRLKNIDMATSLKAIE